MDWYYPMLSGALEGEAGRPGSTSGWDDVRDGRPGRALRLDQRLGDGGGDGRVRPGPRRAGLDDEARRLFADAQGLRLPDGSYWTGMVYPEEVSFPGGSGPRTPRRPWCWPPTPFRAPPPPPGCSEGRGCRSASTWPSPTASARTRTAARRRPRARGVSRRGLPSGGASRAPPWHGGPERSTLRCRLPTIAPAGPAGGPVWSTGPWHKGRAIRARPGGSGCAPLSMDDADVLHRLQSDPEMMRYFGGPYVRRQTETWLEWHVAMWDQEGYSLWAAELKDGGAFVGWIGLSKVFAPEELQGTTEVGLVHRPGALAPGARHRRRAACAAIRRRRPRPRSRGAARYDPETWRRAGSWRNSGCASWATCPWRTRPGSPGSTRSPRARWRLPVRRGRRRPAWGGSGRHEAVSTCSSSRRRSTRRLPHSPSSTHWPEATASHHSS